MVESGLLFKAFDPRARLCPFCIQILTLELESSMSAAEPPSELFDAVEGKRE